MLDTVAVELLAGLIWWFRGGNAADGFIEER